ncbi:MAG: radical SAM protein, partial [Firmicutes bacterium]|nr:radical SAM protein [Bacillota bacterium]
KRRGKLDGVVLSGGEPTLAPDLADFARMCRALGYKVKLDTNGLSDTAVKSLLSQNLFDYVAMDVKAPASKYADAACVPIDISKIRGSIELIKNSGVPYEFRTTFLPTLSPPDIGEIARDLIPGAKLYVIQRYRQVSNEELEVRSGGHGNHTAHSSLERGDGEADGAWRRPSSDFSRAAALAKPYVQEIMLR